jgi:putative membrane protein (TIGR04086 family)
MAFKPPASSRPSVNFTAIFRGIIATLVLALVGSFFLGTIYHFSGLKESTLPLTSSVLLFLSVFTGGFFSSRFSGTRGLLHGLSVGVIIFLAIWLFTGLFLPVGLGFVSLITKLLICSAGGTLGGIIGVGF